MKKFYTFFVILIALSCWLSVADAQIVRMPDANLAAVVRDALGLAPNAPTTRQAMQRLTSLNAQRSKVREVTGQDDQIRDITGLEYATQLRELFLYDNQIRNLTPLAGLTQLKALGLDGNQISNVRPLTGLTQLELLHIGRNQIKNNGVQLLTNLKQLKGLSLYANQISNIKPLANLTKLEGLWLSHNKIRDVSPLAGLVNLETLHLNGNPIKDFSPLASLTNLRDVVLTEEEAVEEVVEEISEEGFEVPEIVFPSAGPKIVGPWLWMIVPTGKQAGKEAAASGKDYLARASGGSVKQNQISKIGATGGTRVGDKVWTWGKLAPFGGDNITEAVNAIGLGDGGDIDNHVAYGSISLESPRRQETTMYAGSDDALKVWLNGKLVHNNPVDRGAFDYQKSFPVTLKKGKNVLLVAIYEAAEEWSGFFGFENDAEYNLIVPETPAGPKIEGPWVWMIVPTGEITGSEAAASGKDFLSKASSGSVKQGQIARKGATAGTVVGNQIWTIGKLAPTGEDNINEAVNAIGLGDGGDIDDHVAYGSISLESPRRQKTTMYVGSDDAVKVWLNGKLVHNNPIDRGAYDYQESFPVTLKSGKNVLLIAVYERGGGWSGFFGFERDAKYSLITPPPPRVRGVIPDFKLAARVRSTLGLGPNAAITEQKLRKLTKLTADYSGIEDLSGLEHATQLKSLSLIGNRISDFSPFAGLKKLKSLSIANNRLQGTSSLVALLKNNPNLKLDITVPTDEHPPIYWLTSLTTDHASGRIISPVKLQRLTSVSATVETLWESSSPVTSNRTHLAIDTVGGKLYWTERIDESRSEIRSINLDGDPNVQTLVTLNSVIHGITVDPKARRLYWTNSLGRIQSSNLNGKHIKTLARNLDTPGDITLDVEAGKLYWTDGLSIRRANLNGKSIQNVVTASSDTGVAIVVLNIAIANRKIYWNQLEADASKYPNSFDNLGISILRADLDGLNIEELIADGSVGLDFAVDVAGEALYYTNSPLNPGSHILRADLDGSEGEPAVYYEDFGGPSTIVLGILLDAVAAAPVNSQLAAAPQVATPDQTGLLANYPNPFNPETWIPYQLAKASDVKITIYDTRGIVVRQLALGHQPPGFYTSRSRAAYWDGRNTLGERVASGIYFYQLEADTISLTRKMLILK